MLSHLAGAGALIGAAAALLLPHRQQLPIVAALPPAAVGSDGGALARLTGCWRGEGEPRWAGRAVLALVVTSAVGGYLAAGPVAALLGGCAAGTAGRTAQRIRRHRRTSRTQAAIVEAVGVLVAELRAGRHPVQSLHAAAECSSALRAAAMTASWGGDVAESLRTSAGRPTGRPTGGSGDPGERTLRAVAAGWLVAERSGAGLADVLGSVESELRSEAMLVAETTAELAGSQATTRVLAGLPVLGVLLGSALGARPVHVLLHTPIGAACTVVGLLLEYAGVAWTARLVSGARPTGGTGG